MILVTGTSGHLGSMTLNHLRALDTEALGASRTPRPGGRLMDFDDPQRIDLSDVTTLVLVSAGYDEDDVVVARHARVLEAVRRDGVGHVVYTSLVGSGDHLGFALPHRATERLVVDSGMSWTILRNGLYAELIGGLLFWQDNCLVSPFGTGAVAAPTRDDLARAAATVAQAPADHAGRTYELTGPAFTVQDIATHLQAGISDIPLAEYRRRLLATEGLLPFQPPMLTSIASAIRHSFLDEHLADLATLLGREPHTGVEGATNAAAASRGAHR